MSVQVKIRIVWSLPLFLSALLCESTDSFCAQSGWKQVWSDEFDNDFDSGAWTKVVNSGGSSTTRDAHGTADSVWVESGALVLRSNGTWNGSAWTNLTSGAVESNGKQSFKSSGVPIRVCVKAKLPGGGGSAAGRGIWPAHWLMPDISACWPCAGEIDIMEMINGDGLLRGTYHWNRDNKSGDDQQSQGWKLMPSAWGDTWHEFAAEYDGVSSVKFAFDGVVYKQNTKSTLSLPGLQQAKFFDVPYYVILNTALGGAWPKPLDANTKLPAYHYVDYVRVAQEASASLLV